MVDFGDDSDMDDLVSRNPQDPDLRPPISRFNANSPSILHRNRNENNSYGNLHLMGGHAASSSSGQGSSVPNRASSDSPSSSDDQSDEYQNGQQRVETQQETWAEATRQAHLMQQNRPNPPASSVGDSEDSNAQVNHQNGLPVRPPYPGFLPSILKIQGDAVHPDHMPMGKIWHKLTPEFLGNMTPARAMRILLPVSLFKRDARNFSEWSMPAGNGGTRAFATASLMSIMFAGTAMGIPSGEHAERKRAEAASNANSNDDGNGGNRQNSGRKEKKPQLVEVSRYAYIPPSNPDDELPMFHIAYEEIRNREDTEVTFIGVWLFIFDPSHSTSKLVADVIKINEALIRSQSAATQDPNLRNKGFATETERRKKAGLGISNLNHNFEATVGMQYGRIVNMEYYYAMLKLHAGGSVRGEGKMFVDDFKAHVSTPWGRQLLNGDPGGHGSFHPAAPEFVFNAKRRQSLAYGATNLDGSPGDINEKYLDPSTYWNGDVFQMPENGDMWICASIDRRTIMELPLPRPLQNQVLPGPHLIRLFVERYEANKLWSFRRMDPPPPRPPTSRSSTAANENASASSDNAADTNAEENAHEMDQEMAGNASTPAASEYGDSPQSDADAHADVVMTDTSGQDVVDEEIERPITAEDHARFRSMATGVNENERVESENIRNALQKYDGMETIIGGAESSFERDGQSDNYRIKTEKMTDRISKESNCIYNELVHAWYVEELKNIDDEFSELEEQGVPHTDPRWEPIMEKRAKLNKRFYNVKSDLAKYQIESIHQCFHCQHDLATLPNGYKAMVRSLETLIEKNGGSASMAFPPGRTGMQITASDRQVWQELQEWLGIIFTKDALIAGRDRHLMDELYLQSFEMYAKNRFVLIICSERGKGKSIRAVRMSKLLPKGFVAWQAASSARAGMNGNMSANNGCMIVFDEMTKDLTPAEVDERIEFWKQTLTNGEYTIERTMRAPKNDGTDSYVTCEIVTDHSVSYAIMTNLGPSFTTGDKEPTSGKHAMINRTFCLFARTETDKASPESAFEANMRSPLIMPRINDFRLFTCIVAFCKLVVRTCAWLQPDLSMANKIWDEADRILTEEYNMPAPEPRRTQRRAEICHTQALMEAVARVYLYKQTALGFEVGKPLPGTSEAKKFQISDLWEVIRLSMVPSRAVIRDAWAKSLSYSVSTSINGINVMTSVCHMANIGISKLFRKMNAPGLSGKSAKEIHKELPPGEDLEEADEYMGNYGSSTEELIKLGERYSQHRRTRNEWRKIASQCNVADLSPLDAIQEVVKSSSVADKLRYANALFPTITMANMHYDKTNILKWAVGAAIDAKDDPLPGNLKYKKIKSGSGSAAKYDYAWVVAKEIETDGVKFTPLVTDMRGNSNGTTPVSLFDMHDAGTNDTLLLLEASEASRLCVEMPRAPRNQNPHFAFKDERSLVPSKESKAISLRPVRNGATEIEVHRSASVECRIQGGGFDTQTVRLHRQLDSIVNQGRLPSLQPYTSARVIRKSPIHREEKVGIVINTVVAFEHMSMVIESSLRAMTISGLKDHQENFIHSKSTGLHGFSSNLRGGAPDAPGGSNQTTTVMPFSNDIVQINWVRDISERQYVDTLESELGLFNEAISSIEGMGNAIKMEDMPQQPIAFMGYPVRLGKAANSAVLMQLLSLPVKTTRDDEFTSIEVSDAPVNDAAGDFVLQNEVARALGRKPTKGEIASYRRDRIGEHYMWEVTGDLNAYSTWCKHLEASMIGKGNAPSGEDPVIESMLDSELMLMCRLRERRAKIEGTEEFECGFDDPWPQSYSAMIKQAESGEIEREARARSIPATKRPHVMSQVEARKAGGSNAYLNKTTHNMNKKQKSSSDAGPSSLGAAQSHNDSGMTSHGRPTSAVTDPVFTDVRDGD